ncbi:hypothetical protein K7X08_030475 [Anisodus acutangulus]|uniref:phosphoethanolamine N-methyltransferase n=1 Tax=Anisodus acutangulus TaxID=402998 RepID=A0A9Q1L773_9SOLA|nr:hypothetical protein K7X08_030475 [Anisodus acutangulus]
MMLDYKAVDLDKEERPEVLSLFPPYEGKTVLELGAGIVHFTGELAKKAGKLIALDFIEGAIKKNESINGHHKNVKFMCADPSQKALDVGCGIGGGDFYMAEKYDVHVVGIDLSINMISFALERAIGLKCAVEFDVADYTKKTYPNDTFDVIYSRDTILHIQDKPTLFKSFYKWLRPGGKILISDYCKSAGPASEELTGYIKQMGYDLHVVEAYGQMLRDADFHEVVAEDRTG